VSVLKDAEEGLLEVAAAWRASEISEDTACHRIRNCLGWLVEQTAAACENVTGETFYGGRDEIPEESDNYGTGYFAGVEEAVKAVRRLKEDGA
jgi:hypothetical protein